MNDGRFFDVHASLRTQGESIRDLAIEKMLLEVEGYFLNDSEGVKVEKSPGGIHKVTLEDGKNTLVYTVDGGDEDLSTPENGQDPLIDDMLSEDGLFGWIPSRLAKYEAKGLNECEDLINGLEKVRKMYGGEGISGSDSSLKGELREVQSRTEHWSGSTATNFEAYFINAFETAAETQKYVIQELMGGVESIRSIKLETENSAREIADATHSALHSYRNGGSGDTAAVALSVVGAALAIGSLAAGQPQGVALVMGLLTLANTAANTAKSVVDNADVEGTCVFEIIDSMDSGLADIESKVDSEIMTLSNSLITSVNNVEVAMGASKDMKKTIVPLRPKLADEVPGSSEFSPPGV